MKIHRRGRAGYALVVAALLSAAAAVVAPTPAFADSDGYQIRNLVNDQCLDVDVHYPENEDGAPIQLWKCNGKPQQDWSFVNGQLVSGHNGKCIGADPALLEQSYVYLGTYDCGRAQKWGFVELACAEIPINDPVLEGYLTALVDPDNEDRKGAPVVLLGGGGDTQMWY